MGTPGRHITRYSYHGHPYQVWEKPVPRIKDALLDCVVYLYDSVQAANDGEPFGGSGFIVSVKFEDNPSRLCHYVVTNDHVIRGDHKVKGATVARINKHRGSPDSVDLGPSSLWAYADDDDLAVCHIELDGLAYRFSHLVLGEFFVDEGTVSQYEIGPGDPTYTVGRFINFEGKQRNTPSVRFGDIAMMPEEPIVIGDNGREQVGFLVEARSLPGYSGSPVFVELSPNRPNGNTILNGQFWLLGIDCAHTNDFAQVLDAGNETKLSVRISTGYMVVVPAWKLTELLMSQTLVDERRTLWQKIKAGLSGAATLD